MTSQRRVAFWWDAAEVPHEYDLCDDDACWFQTPALHAHLPYMETFSNASGVA